MRSTTIGSLTIAISLLTFGQSAEAQRGGRGGGMQRGGGGGMQRGGGGGGGGGFGGGLSGGAGGSRSTGAAGPYGGSGTHNQSSHSGTGANGGQYQSGSRSGTYNTQRGGTVNYGAAGAGGTGAGGTSAGRGAYGVSGTTAGGRSYTDVGRAGGVEGPGGSSAGYRSNAYGASGPNGAVAGGSRYGAAEGPNGAAAGGSRYSGAYGPAGYGAAGNRYGYGAAARPSGTAYVPASALATTGAYTRGAYAGSNYASPAYYAAQPGAWAGAAAMSAAPATYGAVASTAGYPQQPVYNDYGGNVVSQPDAMYVNGDPAGTPQQYAQQAGQIASSGAGAQPDDASAAWQPLGIYALAQDPETPPTDLFQLAINKQGVIRGNYHNTQTNKTEPITGAVDPKSLRAAWVVGQQKAPIYEAGIANLTKDQTTMMIHDASGQSSQATLVRLPAPDSSGAAPQPGATQP